MGRDPSPVLDRYPPKEGAPAAPPPLSGRPTAATRAPIGPVSSTPPASSPSTPPPAETSLPASAPLITLDRAFDLDGFSQLLGETSIRVTVPREDLPEVLRRVTEFMGFGIYVYAIAIRPAPAELLKSYVVELQRVDYSKEKGAWLPFVEKGAVDNPFGSSEASR